MESGMIVDQQSSGTQNYTASWSNTLTAQVKTQCDQLKDAYQQIKQLTNDLKEERANVAEMSARFTKASTEMESFKKSFNFRLNLAKSRE
jgi:septal ring factor EnvC (AmiA/AmiB activator)